MIRKPQHIEYWRRDYMRPGEPAPRSRLPQWLGWIGVCGLIVCTVALRLFLL